MFCVIKRRYCHVQGKPSVTWRRVDPTEGEQHRKAGRGRLIPEKVDQHREPYVKGGSDEME